MTGWICPKCGSCWAPHVDGCKACLHGAVIDKANELDAWNPDHGASADAPWLAAAEKVFGPLRKWSKRDANTKRQRWPEAGTRVYLGEPGNPVKTVSGLEPSTGSHGRWVNFEGDDVGWWADTPEDFWKYWHESQTKPAKAEPEHRWPEPGTKVRRRDWRLFEEARTVRSVCPAGSTTVAVDFEPAGEVTASTPADFWRDWEAVS